MSAYLQFFELEQSPFEGKTGTQVVLGTKALRDALEKIRDGLDEGVARICVSGGPGLGKTSLARALPKLLGEDDSVAVVLDPSRHWDAQRGSLARQWGLENGGLARSGLLEAAREKRLVVVIDRAETASEDFLDHLDVLLSYRTGDDEPVVQSVLLARLGQSEDGQPPPLIWWLDRIQTLQLEFAPLPRDGVEPYIRKHLKRAGWTGERLFTPDAALAIHGYTSGIPGEVSKLCEQLLSEAASSDLREIDAPFVHAFCDETEPVAEAPPLTAAEICGGTRPEPLRSVEEDESFDDADAGEAQESFDHADAEEADESFDDARAVGTDESADEPIGANEDELSNDFEDRLEDDFRTEADESDAEDADDGAQPVDADGGSFDELLLAEEFEQASGSPLESDEAPTIDLVDTVSDTEQARASADEAPEHPAEDDAAEDEGEGDLADLEATSEPTDLGDFDDAEGYDGDGDDSEGSVDDEDRNGAFEEAVHAAAESDPDESAEEFEDYLSAPVSMDELRSIRGTLFARHARAIAAAAALALVGGLTIVWLSDGEAPPAPGMREAREAARPATEASVASDPSSDEDAGSESLARLRGPVPRTEATPEPPQPSPSKSTSTDELVPMPDEPSALEEAMEEPLVERPIEVPTPQVEAETERESQLASEIEASDADEETGPSEEDLVDMRPAALRPGAVDASEPADERF